MLEGLFVFIAYPGDGTQQGLSNLDDHFRATYYGVASFSSRVSFSRKLAEIENIQNSSKQLIT